MWFNYHTHSVYCDGKSTMTQLVDRARSLNLINLGFSSHAPLPFECKWCMNPEHLKDYLTEIEALKSSSKLEIYSGLEVDYIPQSISPADFSSQLDYTIGSIHFVEKFKDGLGWEIDGPHSFFLEGLEAIFNNKIKEVVVRYFELTREMVTTSPPSVVGHLDKIKIQNIDNKFFDETDSWYQDEVKKTVEVIGRSGSIVEVNTRGIYQKKSSTTYPSPWVLELIHERNIPITVSSDAHHHDDLVNQFSETAVILKQLGFREISILHNGQWKSFDFDANGIKRK